MTTKPCSPAPHRSRWSVIALAATLVFTLASCSWTSGDQYFIHWGPARDDVIVRERTSFDLVVARDLFWDNNDVFAHKMGGFRCHANRSNSQAIRCVMRLLHNQTGVPEIAGGVWGRATSGDEAVRFDDFNGAFGAVRSSADGNAQVAKCLTLSVYPHTVNWTVRNRSDSNCRLGKHVWE